MAATQHMTSNNLHVFREDTRLSTREMEQHAIPELPYVTPIPNATVNSGPDAETFLEELMNYTEEVSSQRIPPLVYIDGNNHENCLTGVFRDGKTNENLRNLLNMEAETEQTTKQGPLSQRYMDPSAQAVTIANSPMLQEN